MLPRLTTENSRVTNVILSMFKGIARAFKLGARVGSFDPVNKLEARQSFFKILRKQSHEGSIKSFTAA